MMSPANGVVPTTISRGPSRLFEWAAAVAMVGFVAWPVVTGRPLRSSGHDYLLNIGINFQHFAVFIGIVGVVRLYVLFHHGRFFGLCPWARALCCFLGTIIWIELLMALMNFAVVVGVTSAGVCTYSAFLFGELFSLHRALLDGVEMRHAWRKEKDNARLSSPP